MTCPTCAGYGYAEYDRKGRPVPCRKCAGTGSIGPRNQSSEEIRRRMEGIPR